MDDEIMIQINEFINGLLRFIDENSEEIDDNEVEMFTDLSSKILGE